MTCYDNLAAVALRQIEDKGRDITLTSVDLGIYDPDNDTLSGDVSTSVTIKAVFREYTLKEKEATIIHENDREVLIAASGITRPSIDDIVIDDETLKVINVKEIKPGDVALIYKLQVRK